MQQIKFTLEPEIIEFIEQHKNYGYKSKSEIVRIALKQLREKLDQEVLEASAQLYAEIYLEDQELQGLTEGALIGWPEE